MPKQYAEPTIKKSSAAKNDRLPVKRNEEFFYTWRPEQWEFVEYAPVSDSTGKRLKPKMKWLPRFSTVRMTRGANGITGDAVSRDASSYVGKVQRDGGHVFQFGDKRLGPYADFVLEVPCQHKGRSGTYHLTPWEKPIVVGGRTRFQIDDMGYRDMRNYVLESGILEPMSEAILMDQLDVMDNRIARLEQRAAGAPHLVGKLEEARKRRAEMVAAWDRQFGGTDAE